MIKIYQQHNPGKVPLGQTKMAMNSSLSIEISVSEKPSNASSILLRNEIDTLMAKYVGQEHTMYLKICTKYNVQPEPEIKAASAVPSSPASGSLFGASSGASGAVTGGLFGSSGSLLGSSSGATSSSFGGASSSSFGGTSSSSFGGLEF